MAANNSTANTSPDEIDLLALLERFLLFFRRYRILFFIAILLGLGLGYSAYIAIPNTYRSRLIVHSLYLTNQEHIQVINGWSLLLHRKQYAELAVIWNCKKETLPQLKKMRAAEIQKVYSPQNPNGFYIDVDVTNVSALKSIQEAIVYGLENNEYTKQRLDARKNDLQQLIQEVGNEIGKLESNKEDVENIIKGKAKSSSSLIVDGSNINRQLIDMNEKLLSYKQELKFANAVYVLQSFIPPDKPSDPNPISLLGLGLILFLGIAYLIALFHSLNKSLKKRLKQHLSKVTSQ